MSWQESIKRRLGFDSKPAATRGRSQIQEDDPRWNADTMGNKSGTAQSRGSFRMNPGTKLDTSQIEDRRPDTRSQANAQERTRKLDYMKNVGPPSASTPDRQWDGKTIMRRIKK